MAFTSLQKIRFDDVDGAGIVYYPHFFHLCHNAFEDFFDDAAPVSYPRLINELHRGFPTVSIQSDFTSSLRYGDIALVKFAVDRIGNTSVTFAYEIRRKQDSKLCFSAKITKVLLNLETGGVEPIPEDLRTLFESIL